MSEEFKKIEESLERIQPLTLSLIQKEALWSRIESRLGDVPVASPYLILSSVMHMRVLVPALLVILIVSTGATTALADSARPGDFLFAVDLAAERARLSIVSETKKDDIRVAIADERVEELESLISDESSRRVTRAGNTRNVKQAGTPETEMALFATQVAVDEDTILDTGADDSVHVPENPQPDETMMAKNVIEPTDEEVIGSDEEDTTQRNKDIETALMLIGDISGELEARGNTEGHARVEQALGRLVEKIDELPDEDEDDFKNNFRSFISDKKSGVLEFETKPVSDGELLSPEKEEIDATTTIKIEGDVQGDSIEIETVPHIEVSRPKKDR